MKREPWKRLGAGAYTSRDGRYSLYRTRSKWALYDQSFFRCYVPSAKGGKALVAQLEAPLSCLAR